MTHSFVEYIPQNLEDGVLYISTKYATAVHKCCCGCGSEVVTPLSPKDWYLVFDGRSVSLYPSIGNWSLACRSHYWIKNSEVVWARKWSDKEIAAIYLREKVDSEKNHGVSGAHHGHGHSGGGLWLTLKKQWARFANILGKN